MKIELAATQLITALQADRFDTEDWPVDSRIALAQLIAATNAQPTPDAIGCTYRNTTSYTIDEHIFLYVFSKINSKYLLSHLTSRCKINT